MIKIIIHGCGGKMGRALEAVISENSGMDVAAGIDPRGVSAPYPVFPDIRLCDTPADVIIDFSTSAAVPGLLKYAAEKRIPVVLCTTGLSEETTELAKKVSNTVPILSSPNMSLGVNLLLKLVRQAAETLLDAGFDIELIEKHHSQKTDAPSGTAVAIAEAINEAAGGSLKYVYDRTGTRSAREKNELGIHTIRGGTIPGDHEVIFAGRNEIVEIAHKALSREVFAAGAVKAAEFLAGVAEPGMYSMKDVIG